MLAAVELQTVIQTKPTPLEEPFTEDPRSYELTLNQELLN